ncbi:type 1 fimbrial protein [Cronobacter turicensis]|uniref:fimbrial protein n=1 Tax=Cronobacter turicensis TaxID=413502 RepID=UPI0024C3FD51|nr:type 1 fimbrial protein [Cronobacter turicensis]ELQ6021564.1 type 1 fimbrial protein [Cronobacter turicensis]ELQ6076024.1 type 1 fimbrial protein [Cronobacter turicensis]ELQ6184958.1 type 1 fimbrial protein [Cronobacter turicensis]ELQ6233987.1 type 1 fimbrial protein [Cronobacter turicensis]ELQ6237712.1 type 1 fimbrial protein [Cronobacter turicensis]
MKSNLVSIAVASCFITSMAHAAMVTPDIPATLNIEGTVNNSGSQFCQISILNNVISLNTSENDLVEQGSNATSAVPVRFDVSSISQANGGSMSRCDKEIYEGKIAVRFVGIYDNAEGTSFANTLAGEDAAEGVGIGFFNVNATPLDVSDIYNLPGKSNSAAETIGLQLVKLKGQKVKAGSVAGNVTFQIERL